MRLLAQQKQSNFMHGHLLPGMTPRRIPNGKWEGWWYSNSIGFRYVPEYASKSCHYPLYVGGGMYHVHYLKSKLAKTAHSSSGKTLFFSHAFETQVIELEDVLFTGILREKVNSIIAPLNAVVLSSIVK